MPQQPPGSHPALARHADRGMDERLRPEERTIFTN
jgi:hypothetical protein